MQKKTKNYVTRFRNGTCISTPTMVLPDEFVRLSAEKQKEVPYICSNSSRGFLGSNFQTRAIIVDLDDVLFFTNFIFDEIEKLKLTRDNKWYYFESNIDRLPVNEWCYRFIQKYKNDYKIIFLTARSKNTLNNTQKILKEYFIIEPIILCRDINDTRESHFIKEEWVKKLVPNFAIEFALDDDIKNCEMYAKYGIPVLHVINAEGRTCPNVTKDVKTLAMSRVQSD